MRAKYVLFAFFLLLLTVPSLLAQTLEDPSLRVDQLVSGLSSPTTMAFIAADDILVLQKNDGRVRRVIGGVLQAGQVLDVAVDNDSERGLLGIALHPQFSSNHFVYLYFTESSTGSDTTAVNPLGNRVYRYTWNGSTLTNPTLILDLPVTTGPNHNGGIIIFGPDGKLYIVIGDLNRNGQLQNFALGPVPDNTSVILRLNDDGSTPTDNPFFSQGGNLAKYYAYGIRNSFGPTFDPVTEKLWMTENGPDVYDEINLVEPGFNSGWERLMGPVNRDTQGTSDLFVVPRSHYSDPKFSWLDTVGPTGLVFLNSTALGINYENDLFTGDINGGNLYRFRVNSARTGFIFNPGGGIDTDLVADTPTEVDEPLIGRGFGGITDLKVGPDGLLYVVSFSGRIYVISANAPVTHTLSVASTNPTSGVSISITPNDNNGAGNGTTPFNRLYNEGTLVTLTAPATAGTNAFLKWQRDGVDNASTQTTQVTVDANHTMTAVYGIQIIIDNAPAGQTGNGTSFTGKWCAAKSTNFFGASSLESCGKGLDTYRWTPTIPTTGSYDVYVWWTEHRKNSNNVPITVCHAAGCTTTNFNQQQNGGQWNLHGRYSFNAGTGGHVQVTDQNGRAIADAVRFVP